jgi:hypothetical protein
MPERIRHLHGLALPEPSRALDVGEKQSDRTRGDLHRFGHSHRIRGWPEATRRARITQRGVNRPGPGATGMREASHRGPILLTLRISWSMKGPSEKNRWVKGNRRALSSVKVTKQHGIPSLEGASMIGKRDGSCAQAPVSGGSVMTCSDISDVQREALFASPLQRSDSVTAEAAAEAISRTIAQLGRDGCASRMAQEFGDHPEAACDRMRWARRVVRDLSLCRTVPATAALRSTVPATARRAA